MRNYLFIDGSNLYTGQYDLLGSKKYLNFNKFINKIQKELKTTFNKIYFYASYSPQPKRLNKKQKEYLKNEALFYKNVKNTAKVNFFNGYRSKTSGKEKEVDVKLAVDIVDFCHQNKLDNVYLFSGDADFNHALIIAKKLKKKTFILALQNRIPNRFAYLYKTFVFILNKNRRFKAFPEQKTKQIFLKDGLIENI